MSRSAGIVFYILSCHFVFVDAGDRELRIFLLRLLLDSFKVAVVIFAIVLQLIFLALLNFEKKRNVKVYRSPQVSHAPISAIHLRHGDSTSTCIKFNLLLSKKLEEYKTFVVDHQ